MAEIWSPGTFFQDVWTYQLFFIHASTIPVRTFGVILSHFRSIGKRHLTFWGFYSQCRNEGPFSRQNKALKTHISLTFVSEYLCRLPLTSIFSRNEVQKTTFYTIHDQFCFLMRICCYLVHGPGLEVIVYIQGKQEPVSTIHFKSNVETGSCLLSM